MYRIQFGESAVFFIVEHHPKTRKYSGTIDSRGEGLETQGFHAAHACHTGNRQKVNS